MDGQGRTIHSMSTKISKTDADWARDLTPEQFHILREKGTAGALQRCYWDSIGRRVRRAAPAAVRTSSRRDTKFDSRNGWPSFFAPADPAAIEVESDRTFFMVRNEVHCSACGGHLGHVFDDGPNPTGLRYCINSASLTLAPTTEAEG